MYQLIEKNCTAIISSIPRSHVTKYDWLMHNAALSGSPAFQTRYKNFWRLNAARLSPDYCQTYFAELRSAQLNTTSPDKVAARLFATPTHRNGRQSLQFSFATKLVHTADPTTPIYDSLIAAFYFFQEPSQKLSLPKRIAHLTAFQKFLVQEYQRILSKKLLARSISSFRKHFKAQNFTDQKVIDSLLWSFVGLLKRGEIVNRQITY